MKTENVSRGRLIAIEGVDGAGKSTQIRLLAQALQKEGRQVFLTCEPTCKSSSGDVTAPGALVGQVLRGELAASPCEIAALFLADRIAHNTDPVFGIRTYLERGWDVITDRYYYSSFAYQGKDTDLRWVLDQNRNCPDIEKPDLCIFLDLDPDAARRRREARGEVTGEQAEIYERPDVSVNAIRDKFLEVFSLLPDENVHVISADGSIEEVAARVYAAAKEVLL